MVAASYTFPAGLSPLPEVSAPTAEPGEIMTYQEVLQAEEAEEVPAGLSLFLAVAEA